MKNFLTQLVANLILNLASDINFHVVLEVLKQLFSAWC